MFEAGVGDYKLKLATKVQKMLTVGIDFARAVLSNVIFPGREIITYQLWG
mgnify:CR=1